MNAVVILYDGNHSKTECCCCGDLTSKRYRAFMSAGSFSFPACNQEHAEAAYVSFDDATERMIADRNQIGRLV